MRSPIQIGLIVAGIALLEACAPTAPAVRGDGAPGPSRSASADGSATSLSAQAPGELPCLGGVLVAYESGPAPAPAGSADGEDWDIAAQCLSGAGEMGWNEGHHSAMVSASAQRERRPSVVSDGAGGAIIAVEISYLSEDQQQRSSDVVAQRVGPRGELLWVEGQRSALVATTVLAEEAPVAVSDGTGGAIIFFEVGPPGPSDPADRDVFAQRLGPDGQRQWLGGQRNVAVSTSPLREANVRALPDGASGAFVAFEIGDPAGGEPRQTDIVLQHVDAQGRLVWGEGRLVAGSARAAWSARRPRLVDDGEGGVIVVFEAAWYGQRRAGDVDILAARFDRAGRALWETWVPFLAVATAPLPARARAALADGHGGVLVFFEVETLEGERAGRVDIFGQRLDATGRATWNEGRFSSPVSSGRWQERRPSAVGDGAGGAIVVFEAEHGAGTHAGDIDIAAQRVGANGELLWLGGERSADLASTPLLELSSQALPDGEGGAFVIYEAVPREGDEAGNSLIVAVRVSGTGELLWHGGQHPSIVAASNRRERRPAAVTATPAARPRN